MNYADELERKILKDMEFEGKLMIAFTLVGLLLIIIFYISTLC